MNFHRRTLLFFCADYLQAYTWSKNHLLHIQDFTQDAIGHQQFAKFLQQHRQPVLLLVDIIEEDFRHERLPRLSRRHRSALILRKLDQLYPKTSFRQSRWIRLSNSNRREYSLLLSALNTPERLTPWLTILDTQTVPLIGIQSVAHLGATLLTSCRKPYLLLLSWNKLSGLRQSFYVDGQLHFSRLIPLSAYSSFSKAVESEMPRLLQFLSSQNLLPAEEPLHVAIICQPADQAELKLAIDSNNALVLHFLDIQNLGETLNVNQTYLESDATPLYLQTLVSTPLGQQYANTSHRHIFHLWKIRLSLFLLAATLIFLSGVGTSYQYAQTRTAYESATVTSLQSPKLSAELAALTALYPAELVPGHDMKAAVLLSQKLSQLAPPPLTSLASLSHVLNDYPNIQLDTLTWKNFSEQLPLPAAPEQQITLTGELLSFDHDYRHALDYLAEFQRALIVAGYLVKPKLLPLDITPSGELSDVIYANNSSKFSFELIWREAP